jgi:hypothetical protein
VKRSTGGNPGQPLSSETITLSVPTLSCQGEGHTSDQRNQDREPIGDATESQTLRMDGHSPHGNREIPEAPLPVGGRGRLGKVIDRTSNAHVSGKSDDLIVPEKQANKVGSTPAAESVEGRGSAKGNVARQTAVRTQSRVTASFGLSGVRQAARRETRLPTNAFTSPTQGKSRMR